MRTYGLVDTQFWNNPDIRSLSDDGRLLALYLLTCPHTTIIGAFLCPDGYIADGLQWPIERVRQTLTETVSIGFTRRFRDGRHIVICNYLKWNPIQNPNMGCAAIAAAMRLPPDPAFEYIIKGLEPYANRLGNGFETVRQRFAQGYPNQDQDQEQYQKKEPQGSVLPSLRSVRTAADAAAQPEVVGSKSATTMQPEPPKPVAVAPSEPTAKSKPAPSTPTPPPPAPAAGEVPKDPDDPWVEIYARGKQVLGRNAGGLITNLKLLYDGKPRKVAAKIEDAAEQREPREWMVAFLLKADDGGRLSGQHIG